MMMGSAPAEGNLGTPTGIHFLRRSNCYTCTLFVILIVIVIVIVNLIYLLFIFDLYGN